MRISKISINGFGKFNDVSYDLDAPLTLFYGHNEAGKSTVMHFIRTMLFGFPTRSNRAERYEPLHGGRHGGLLILTDENGNQYRVERYDKSSDGHASMQVTTDDGTVGGEALLQSLLGDVSAEVFRHVFAFTLSELQELRTLQTAEINSFLSFAGTGIRAKTMFAAEKQLRQQMDQLFRPRGQVQPINQLAEQLQEAEQQLATSRMSSERYGDILQQLQAIENEVKQLDHNIKETARRIDWLERCLRGHEDWNMLHHLQAQLQALKEVSAESDDTTRSNRRRQRSGAQSSGRSTYRVKQLLTPLSWCLLALNVGLPALLFLYDHNIASIASFALITGVNVVRFRRMIQLQMAELQQREQEAAQMMQLEQDMAQIEQYLRAIAGDEGRDALEQQWQRTSYQDMRRMLAEQQEHAASLAFRKNELHHLKGRLQGEADRLISEEQLNIQQQQYEELLASMQQMVGQWASSAFCLDLLQQTKATLDEKQQPALMRKASLFFASLTDQQFTRVMAPLHEDVIKVERASGEVVDASWLSRGTAEQLYLALRFALIEQFREVPLPIVMDDILVNFDPERLRRTLSLCAQLSERRQIILFTCHPHIREQLALISPDYHCIAL